MLPERRSGATLAAALGPARYSHDNARGLEVSPRAASCRMSLSSVKSETASRSRLFSSSRSLLALQPVELLAPPTSPRSPRPDGLRPPCSCETRTSTATASQRSLRRLYRFLLDVKDIPQVGSLQWEPITPSAPDFLLATLTI